jgi:hypothetical protein
MSKTFRRIDDDDDDILRDKEHLRVEMRALDHLRQNLATTVTDASGDSGLGLHRPGYRIADASSSAERQRVYDKYEDDLTSAWRDKPKPPTRAGSGGAQVGDICTVRAGAGAHGPGGAPGHLQLIGGELVCVCDPEFRQQGNASDALKEDQRAKAYDAYDRQLRDAWRT